VSVALIVVPMCRSADVFLTEADGFIFKSLFKISEKNQQDVFAKSGCRDRSARAKYILQKNMVGQCSHGAPVVTRVAAQGGVSGGAR